MFLSAILLCSLGACSPINEISHVYGHWVVNRENGCQETYVFDEFNNFSVFANKRIVKGKYSDKNNRLTFVQTSDNGKVDCDIAWVMVKWLTVVLFIA